MNPLNTLCPPIGRPSPTNPLGLIREEGPSPAMAPEPGPSLANELHAVLMAVDMAQDELTGLIARLHTVSYDAPPCDSAAVVEQAAMPPALSVVRSIREQVEFLTVRISEARMRLALE